MESDPLSPIYDDDLVEERGDNNNNNFHINVKTLKLDRYFTSGDHHQCELEDGEGEVFGADDGATPSEGQLKDNGTSERPLRDEKKVSRRTVPANKHAVDALHFVSLSPAAVAKETEIALSALEPGHFYNSIAAPIGVPEPRPEYLISRGMTEAPRIDNALATALVVADRTAATYESARQEILLWRRWGDIHPNPVLFGPEVFFLSAEGNEGAKDNSEETHDGKEPEQEVGEGNTRKNKKKKEAKTHIIPVVKTASIQHLRPLCLSAAAGGITHPSFVPTFQRLSVMDDHFFLLGLAAAVSQDAGVLEKAFANAEYLDSKGLITIRLFSDQRVELPSTSTASSSVVAQHARRGRGRHNNSSRRSMNSTFNGGDTNNTSAAAAAAATAPPPPPSSVLVTLPMYLTLDTLLPVSKAASDTISPAHLDLAIGRTYDAVNEFYVAFLAKAFATLKGTYAALHGGSSPEVIRCLIPGEGKYVRWNEEVFENPAVRDALRKITGGARARSIAASIDSEKIETLASTSEEPTPSTNNNSEENNNSIINTANAAAAFSAATGPAAAIHPQQHRSSLPPRPTSSAAVASSLAASSSPVPGAGLGAISSSRPSSGKVPSTATASGGAGKRVSIMEGGVVTSTSSNPQQQQQSGVTEEDTAKNASDLQSNTAATNEDSEDTNNKDEDSTSYRAAAETALLIQSARKNAEELWWLLQEATLNHQPMLFTNTNLCQDGSLLEEGDNGVFEGDRAYSSFGAVPTPISDSSLHVEDWHKFNWSYGVVVLAAVEIDTSVAISDGYLRAIRRRGKRSQGDVRRLVKVRSVYRSNHPDYAKLRGEWALPHGGGVTPHSETYINDDDSKAFGDDAEAAAAAALLRAYNVEEQENERVNGGNPNWTSYAQEYLQYNALDAIKKQSEDTVWWMTIDEVCRHFNCFYSLYNTNSASTLAPPQALVDAVTALAMRDEETKRRPRDPFKPKEEEEQDGSARDKLLKIRSGGVADESSTSADSASVFHSSPAALLSLLKYSVAEDTTAIVGDTTTRLVNMPPSPSISMAHPNFPHFLLTVSKSESLDSLGRRIELPEGADIRFKSIFDVKPNELDLGDDETDDEERSRGMSGTMTSRTGSAVDITVTPQNALQIEVRVSVPKPLAARKDFCAQLYRVTGPFKQACTRSVRDGKHVATFPLHTKVQVRSLPPQIVTTALTSLANGNDTASASSYMSTASSWGGFSNASGSSTSSTASASDGNGGFSRCFTFECDVNTGHYNVVVMPDPETTPSSNMYVQDSSLIQVSVTKRLNGENFDVSLVPL